MTSGRHRSGGRRPAVGRWTRAGVGLAGLAASAAAVHEDRVGLLEAPVFRLVNELPDGILIGAWPVMQLGALGAVPVAVAASWRVGDRRLAAHLLVTGTGSWLLAKAVKTAVRRPRPGVLLPSARSRGAAASGLGFVSGHAAVAAALGAGVVRRYPAARRPALAVVAAVGLARVYVGAHLPLDVVGGFALGVAADAMLPLPTHGRQR